MKLSNFLVAVGFLTLSVALPAPTPSFTGVNVVPTSPTMTTVIPTPAPTLMPRGYVEDYCLMIELGLAENRNFRTVTLNRTGVTRISRLKARMDMKDWCKSIKEGKLTYQEYKLPPPGQTTNITLPINPYGDP